jgi:hypothetical protein
MLLLIVMLAWNVPAKVLAYWAWGHIVNFTKDLLALAPILFRLALRSGSCLVLIYLLNYLVVWLAAFLALMHKHDEMSVMVVPVAVPVAVPDLWGPATASGSSGNGRNYSAPPVRSGNNNKHRRRR